MAELGAKARLYEAAVDLMGRNGIAATSTREILAAVGIKNPSAISYHFGSKADLVDAIAEELASGQHATLEQQTALTLGPTPPTVTEWVAPAIERSIGSLSNERSCLFDRLWWEFDGYLRPQALETFLRGDSETAIGWRAALDQVFPQFPPRIALARNVTAMRTIGWMLARMAAINLAEDPFPVRTHERFRRWIEEIAVTLLATPTALTDADLQGLQRLS